MGVTKLPPELQAALEFLGGSRWPEGDPHALRAIAAAWQELTKAIDAMEDATGKFANGVSANMEGEIAKAWTDAMRGEVRAALHEARDAARSYHKIARNTAADIEYTQISIVAQLVILAATLAFSWIPFIGQAVTAAVAASVRAIIWALIKAVVKKILSQAIMGTLFSVGLDAAIQAHQLRFGTRDEWNSKLTENAAVSGVISGAASGAMGGLIRPLTKFAAGGQFGRLPGKVLDTAPGKLANDIVMASTEGTGAVIGETAAERLLSEPQNKRNHGSDEEKDNMAATFVSEGVSAFGKRGKGGAKWVNEKNWSGDVLDPSMIGKVSGQVDDLSKISVNPPALDATGDRTTPEVTSENAPPVQTQTSQSSSQSQSNQQRPTTQAQQNTGPSGQQGNRQSLSSQQPGSQTAQNQSSQRPITQSGQQPDGLSPQQSGSQTTQNSQQGSQQSDRQTQDQTTHSQSSQQSTGQQSGSKTNDLSPGGDQARETATAHTGQRGETSSHQDESAGAQDDTSHGGPRHHTPQHHTPQDSQHSSALRHDAQIDSQHTGHGPATSDSVRSDPAHPGHRDEKVQQSGPHPKPAVQSVNHVIPDPVITENTTTRVGRQPTQVAEHADAGTPVVTGARRIPDAAPILFQQTKDTPTGPSQQAPTTPAGSTATNQPTPSSGGAGRPGVQPVAQPAPPVTATSDAAPRPRLAGGETPVAAQVTSPQATTTPSAVPTSTSAQATPAQSIGSKTSQHPEVDQRTATRESADGDSNQGVVPALALTPEVSVAKPDSRTTSDGDSTRPSTRGGRDELDGASNDRDASPAHTEPSPAQPRDAATIGKLAAADPSRGTLTGQVTRILAGKVHKPLESAWTKQITTELVDNPNSFRGPGRMFQVRTESGWHEVRVRIDESNTHAPVMPAATATGPKQDLSSTSGAKVDSSNQISQAGSVTVGGFVGNGLVTGIGTVKATLPVAARTQNFENSVNHQWTTRQTKGPSTTDSQADLVIEVRKSDGAPSDPVTVPATVTRVMPDHLTSLTLPTRTRTHPLGDFGLQPLRESVIEHVRLLDNPFDKVAPDLGSAAHVGGEGRGLLWDFLSPDSLTRELGRTWRGDWTESDVLAGPHDSRIGRARIRIAEVHSGLSELLDVNDRSTIQSTDQHGTGTGTGAASKVGVDVTGMLVVVPPETGVGPAATAAVAANKTLTTTTGGAVTHKSALEIKSPVLLHRIPVTLEVGAVGNTKTHLVRAEMLVRSGEYNAKSAGLPVPSVSVTPGTTEQAPRVPVEALPAIAAAGQVKTHGLTFDGDSVMDTVLKAVRDIPGIRELFPESDKPVPGHSREALEAMQAWDGLRDRFSAEALGNRIGSLLDESGINHHIKKRGLFTSEHVHIKVRAVPQAGELLTSADAHLVRTTRGTTGKLDSNHADQRLVTGGLEARISPPGPKGTHSVSTMLSVGLQATVQSGHKTTAGPSLASSVLHIGSSPGHLFGHPMEFTVEVSSFTRPRKWLRRVTLDHPGRTLPPVQHQVTCVLTGRAGLWLSNDLAGIDPEDLTPGAADTMPIDSVKLGDAVGLVDGKRPEGFSVTDWKFVSVAAVAHSGAVHQAALDTLTEAANKDSVLGMPGTHSRAKIDAVLSPEALTAKLGELASGGTVISDLVYSRRAGDRLGALAGSVTFENPAVVTTIDGGIGAERSVTGGAKVSAHSAVEKSLDFTMGLTVKGSTLDNATGGGVGTFSGKQIISKTSEGTTRELTSTVQRKQTLSDKQNLVLVRTTASVHLIAESRTWHALVDGPKEFAGRGEQAKVAGKTVKLIDGVLLWMTEQQARNAGVVLPGSNPDSTPESASPVETGARKVLPDGVGVGHAVVEALGDIGSVFDHLRARLGGAGKRLLPSSILDDVMSNVDRTRTLISKRGVESLLGSLLDDGVSLQSHDAGLFRSKTHLVVLKARLDDLTVADDNVDDGGKIASTITATTKDSTVVTQTGGGEISARVVGTGGTGTPTTAVTPVTPVQTGPSLAGKATHGSAETATTATTTTKTVTISSSGSTARLSGNLSFEVVVHHGDGKVTTIDDLPGKPEIHLRVPSDNLRVRPPQATDPGAVDRVVLRPGDVTPDGIRAWQDMTGTKLPEVVAVEDFLGSSHLRAAAADALRLAGANKGILGGNTTAAHALRTVLSWETIRAQLPSWLTTKGMELPGVREISLLPGQEANLTVYGTLSNPRLLSVSDTTKLEYSQQSSTGIDQEKKHTENVDITAGVVTVDVDGPHHKGGTPGIEARVGTDIATGTSTAPLGDIAANSKPDAGTALVQFNLEARFVARAGNSWLPEKWHGSGALAVTLPGAVQLRVPKSWVDTQPGLTGRIESTPAGSEHAAVNPTGPDSPAPGTVTTRGEDRGLVAHQVKRRSEKEARGQAERAVLELGIREPVWIENPPEIVRRRRDLVDRMTERLLDNDRDGAEQLLRAFATWAATRTRSAQEGLLGGTGREGRSATRTSYLTTNGLIVQSVPGDGDCFFRSVQASAGPRHRIAGLSLLELRQHVAAHLNRDRTRYRDFVAVPDTVPESAARHWIDSQFDGAVADLRQAGFWNGWVGDLVPRLMSDAFQMPIDVVSENRPVQSFGPRSTGERPVAVVYNGSNHYDATRRATRTQAGADGPNSRRLARRPAAEIGDSSSRPEVAGSSANPGKRSRMGDPRSHAGAPATVPAVPGGALRITPSDRVRVEQARDYLRSNRTDKLKDLKKAHPHVEIAVPRFRPLHPDSEGDSESGDPSRGYRSLRPDEDPRGDGLRPPQPHDQNISAQKHVMSGSRLKVKSAYVSMSRSIKAIAMWSVDNPDGRGRIAMVRFTDDLRAGCRFYDLTTQAARDAVFRCGETGLPRQQGIDISAAKASQEILVKYGIGKDAIEAVFDTVRLLDDDPVYGQLKDRLRRGRLAFYEGQLVHSVVRTRGRVKGNASPVPVVVLRSVRFTRDMARAEADAIADEFNVVTLELSRAEAGALRDRMVDRLERRQPERADLLARSLVEIDRGAMTEQLREELRLEAGAISVDVGLEALADPAGGQSVTDSLARLLEEGNQHGAERLATRVAVLRAVGTTHPLPRAGEDSVDFFNAYRTLVDRMVEARLVGDPVEDKKLLTQFDREHDTLRADSARPPQPREDAPLAELSWDEARTRARNAIRAVISDHGIQVPKVVKGQELPGAVRRIRRLADLVADLLFIGDHRGVQRQLDKFRRWAEDRGRTR